MVSHPSDLIENNSFLNQKDMSNGEKDITA